MSEGSQSQDRSRLSNVSDVVPWDEAISALLEYSVRAVRERVLRGGVLRSGDGQDGIADKLKEAIDAVVDVLSNVST